MSSRCTSIRTSAVLRPRLTCACTALTSELLPMPRAPHRSALLAGRPSAKRRVLAISVSRWLSIALSNSRSMLATSATSVSAPRCGSQTKASPFSGSALGRGAGASRSSAAAARASNEASAWAPDLVRFFIPKPLFFHGCKQDRHGYSPPALPAKATPAHEHVRSDVSGPDADRTHVGDLLLASLAPATAARQAVARAGGQSASRRHCGDGGHSGPGGQGVRQGRP